MADALDRDHRQSLREVRRLFAADDQPTTRPVRHYVDPVVWARTVAPFAVPIAPGPRARAERPPRSSTCSTAFPAAGPQHETTRPGDPGQRAAYPPNWRRFLTAVDAIALRAYVERSGSSAAPRLRRSGIRRLRRRERFPRPAPPQGLRLPRSRLQGGPRSDHRRLHRRAARPDLDPGGSGTGSLERGTRCLAPGRGRRSPCGAPAGRARVPALRPPPAQRRRARLLARASPGRCTTLPRFSGATRADRRS